MRLGQFAGVYGGFSGCADLIGLEIGGEEREGGLGGLGRDCWLAGGIPSVEGSLQQLSEPMSSIIDDLLFYRLKNQKINGSQKREGVAEESLASLVRKTTLNSNVVVIQSDQEANYVSSKQKVNGSEYCIRMKVDKGRKAMKVEARLLKNFLFQKITSKHNQILLFKEISNQQCVNNLQSTLYVHRGSIVMTQWIYVCLGESMGRQKLTEFYAVLNRNLTQFSHFIKKHENSEGHFVLGDPNDERLEKDLLLTQRLSTTNTTFGSNEEASRHSALEDTNKLKKQDIRRIRDSIVHEAHMERLGEFYENITPSSRSEWLKGNLEQMNNLNEKRFGGLLSMAKFSGARHINDYVFNTVKVTVKEVMPKPVSEGGSCHIFVAKANITFISSVDSTVYMENEPVKERLIAIKKLKPELEKKFAHKLEHEKNIVSRLKGGCSYFIPKYFKSEQELDAADTLMMEYIQGTELDFFVMTRIETISLWTKICILLNLIHALRFLASYQIVHLDVKPINVLVCKQLITKLIDYGEAYHNETCHDTAYAPGYTFPYAAPEVFQHFKKDPVHKNTLELTEKQDVFAFGMLMAEILFNCKVFNFTQAKFKEVYGAEDILQRFLLSPERLDCFGDRRVVLALGQIMVQCLDKDPIRRPKLDWVAISLKLILTTCAG